MYKPVRREPAGHAHGHTTHPHEHATEEAAPASADNLLLDIGGDTGALIVHTAAHRDQAEIEISPADAGRARTHNACRTHNAGRTDHVARTHNVVRRREAAGGVSYAAVFPEVPAGDYVVWRDDDTPAGTVTVHGGAVASFRFDQALFDQALFDQALFDQALFDHALFDQALPERPAPHLTAYTSGASAGRSDENPSAPAAWAASTPLTVTALCSLPASASRTVSASGTHWGTRNFSSPSRS
jgi:hypothetical protein